MVGVWYKFNSTQLIVRIKNTDVVKLCICDQSTMVNVKQVIKGDARALRFFPKVVIGFTVS
jgi:hypothetical protein